MTIANTITLDIETYRTRNPRAAGRITQEALDKRPANNTLKAIKLEWDTEGARQARIAEALDKTAVDPMLAEILCIAVQADGGSPICFDGMGAPEKSAMVEFCAWFTAFAGPKTIICGHNIAGFDLGILLNRMRVHGLTPPSSFPVFWRGRWRGWVFDSMEHIPNNRAGFVSLRDACEMFGVDAKDYFYHDAPMHGGRVAEAFGNGDYTDILAYCSADVRHEYELYQALTAGGRWGTFGLDDGVGSAIAELESSGLTGGALAVAKLTVLEQAGLVPRVAA